MIYILLLEKDKWYIGYTDRKDGERFKEHFAGQGSKWTQKYKPIEVIEWREGSEEDENIITLEYMQMYGWWNVRGGKYCNVEMAGPPAVLKPKLPKKLNEEKEKVSGKCTKRIFKNGHWITINLPKTQIIEKVKKVNKKNCSTCGRKTHTSSSCNYKKDIYGQDTGPSGNTFSSDEDSFDEYESDDADNSYKSNKCYRCGRIGHYSSNCYATKHIKGYFIN